MGPLQWGHMNLWHQISKTSLLKREKPESWCIKKPMICPMKSSVFLCHSVFPWPTFLYLHVTAGEIFLPANSPPLSAEVCSELAVPASEGLNWEFAAVSPFCPRHSAENIWLLLVCGALFGFLLILCRSRGGDTGRKKIGVSPAGFHTGRWPCG